MYREFKLTHNDGWWTIQAFTADAAEALENATGFKSYSWSFTFHNKRFKEVMDALEEECR